MRRIAERFVMAVYACADADAPLPSKNTVKASQLEMVPKTKQNDTIMATFGGFELDSRISSTPPEGKGTCSGFDGNQWNTGAHGMRGNAHFKGSTQQGATHVGGLSAGGAGRAVDAQYHLP